MRSALKMLVGIAVAIGCLLPAVVWSQSAPGGLDTTLNQMDTAAKKFTTTEANLIWDEYQKVVNEHELKKGKIYFRREGAEVQMAVDFTEPDKQSLRYSGGKLQVYLPKADEVNEYTAGKNRADMESYLVLGFGARGHDLLKLYDVKFLGLETANGVKAEKLELIPKSDRLRNDYIERILLWIDPARGISVQQQFFQPGGSDYRLATYSDIKIDQKLPDDAFKLKTTKKTKFVPPPG
jgi:outer membrane lipoprotein-sorting protein